jgi:tetratricopeptide (TPR) repeat protein
LGILIQALDMVTENDLQDGRWATINNLGMTYSALGRYDEAIRCYTIVLEGQFQKFSKERTQGNLSDDLQKQVVNTSSNLGLACKATAQFEAAIKTFETSINMEESIWEQTSCHSKKLR